MDGEGPLSRPDSTANHGRKCPGCGHATQAAGHMCHPFELIECPYCGKKPSPAGHTCPDKLKHAGFVCIRCGRLAPVQSLLCDPLELDDGR
ncbi:MAG: hypothetical protein M0Z52_09775 [Actinomycetota bacterium]|nr:hypothetical protein [Actinomycetota bacterium]